MCSICLFTCGINKASCATVGQFILGGLIDLEMMFSNSQGFYSHENSVFPFHFISLSSYTFVAFVLKYSDCSDHPWFPAQATLLVNIFP